MATPKIASAACGTSLPFIFSNNVSIVDASTTNANNQFLLNCALAVDNTQIGSAGIYASQIIPTTVGRATFGGTIGYTFPAGLTIAGFTTAGVVTNSATGALSTTPVLPVANGGTGSATQNFVDLTTAQSIGGTKTLTSGLLFTDGTNYFCEKAGSDASGSALIFLVGSTCSSGNSFAFETSGNIVFTQGSVTAVSFQQSAGAATNFFGGQVSAPSVQVGSSGYVSTNVGTGHTYPYDIVSGSGSTADHIERGIVSATASGTTVTFVTPFASSFECTASPDTGTVAAYNIAVAHVGLTSVVFRSASTVNADYICIGN